MSPHRTAETVALIDLGGCSQTQTPPPPRETQTGIMSWRLLAKHGAEARRFYGNIFSDWSLASLSLSTVLCECAQIKGTISPDQLSTSTDTCRV